MTFKKEGYNTSVYRWTELTYDQQDRTYEAYKCNTTSGARVSLLSKSNYNTDGMIWKVENANNYNIEYTYDGAHRETKAYNTYTNKRIEHDYTEAVSSRIVTTNIYSGSSGGTLLGSYVHENYQNGNPRYLTSPKGIGSPQGIETEYLYANTTHGLLSQVNYDISRTDSPYTQFTYETTSGGNSRERLWLSTLKNYRSDDSLISSFAYTYDTVGNRKIITEANGDHTDYEYDLSDQLRIEERKTSLGARIYKYTYEYDTAGNRTLKILEQDNPPRTNSYTADIDDNNLLTQVTGGGYTCTFSYDNLGRLDVRNHLADWDYNWDELDNMTTATRTDTTPDQVVSFKYDALRNRVERIDQNGVTRYLYDGDTLIAELDGTNEIIAWFTPGVCMSRYSDGEWKTYYYATDALGTTRQVVDDVQRTTDEYAYNAWGEEFAHLRNYSDPDKPENPLRFVGKAGYYSDDSIGLDLLGVRWYDPLIGRFISQDPSRDGMNWYAYAGNNPLGNIDPSGLSWRDGGWGEAIPLLGAAFARWGDTTGRYDIGEASGTDVVLSYLPVGGELVVAAFGGLALGELYLGTGSIYNAALGVYVKAAVAIGGIGAAGAGAGRTAANAAAEAGRKGGGGRSVYAQALDDALQPNRINHYFKEKHLLDPLVKQFGSKEAVVRQVTRAVVKLNLPETGKSFMESISVGGQNVTVTGKVVNGIPRISNFYVPGGK